MLPSEAREVVNYLAHLAKSSFSVGMLGKIHHGMKHYAKLCVSDDEIIKRMVEVEEKRNALLTKRG